MIRIRTDRYTLYTEKIRITEPLLRRGDGERSDKIRKFWGEFILHYPYAYAVLCHSGYCNVGVIAEMLR